MGLLNRFFDKKGESIKTVRQELANSIRVNALCSSYENLFAQVRPMIDEMKVVIPYGVGKNGARLLAARTPELQILDSPNDDMGRMEFMDLVLSTWLTEREVNIHVHLKGNKVKGFTVLPVGCRTRNATGENVFQVSQIYGGTETLSDAEVMTIRFSRSPRNMDFGVSPATSVEVWAQIDDVLAQYQRAYFENGATPASITFITASTKEKYDAKRAKMERGFHGASNKNKTLYVWKQMLDDGSTANEVEVKPIQGNNSTMAIKEIVEIVNDRLNKSVGVSNFILGDDSSAKYDNAELSDHQFTKRRVYPALVSFWSQFQHELDRITGGLGYGISFDLEIPELTERAKTKSEITATTTNTLINLISAGASPTAALRALKLGDDWIGVATGIYERSLEGSKSEPEAAEVVETVVEANEQEKPVQTASNDELGHCSCCNHTNDYDGEPVFANNEAAENKIYDALYKLAEKILLEKHSNLTDDQIHQAVSEVLFEKVFAGESDAAIAIAGQVDNKTVAGEINSLAEREDFVLSDEFKAQLERRVDEVIGNYIDYTTTIKNDTFGIAEFEGWTAAQLNAELQDKIPKARAEMIARNETVHAFRTGGIESSKNLAAKYGLNINLVWQIADEGACEVCKAMNGKKVKAGDAFPDHAEYMTEDGEVQVGWEHNYYNDDGQEPNAHPNCRCTYLVEVE